MRRLAFVSLSLAAGMAAAGPAGANEFEQVWSCSLRPGHTLDDARSVSAQWLAAARSMPGGDGLGLSLRWPIAVADSAEKFEFVVRAPSLTAWGAFYDNYHPDSPAGRTDEVFATVASCSGSALWEHIGIGDE